MSEVTAPAKTTTLSPETVARAIRGPVLLASHGRSRTDAAPDAAQAIAARLGARVEVVAVLEPLPVYTLGYDAPFLPPDFEEDRKTELSATVSRRLEAVFGARERWQLDVRYGAPGRVIPEVARERRAGLIVLGREAQGPIDRLFADDVPLQVVRNASVPVLAISPTTSTPIRRVVVGMDFSAASVHAARTALSLLEPSADSPALLVLVHVHSALDDAHPLLASWTQELPSHVAAMQIRVRDLLRPYAPDGVNVETRTLTGRVLDCLQSVAAEVDADVIAVGTHGPGWMERLFIGSVATSVLRHAAPAVLVAPTPPPAERVRLELRLAGQVALSRVVDWPGALDMLTRRNLGRHARLEVTDPEQRGFVVEAERYRFRGATYDPRARQLTIMLGDDAGGLGHLAHGIAEVRSVEIVAAGDHSDRMLLVESARGHTVLTFLG
ncbi:MAG: universal stress protein [Gemmatirosa sp.]